MSEEQLKNSIVETLGYASFENLETVSGLTFEIGRENSMQFQIEIEHSDLFYSSYSRTSVIVITKNEGGLFPEDKKLLKTRYSAKKRQARILENIKIEAIPIIQEFINRSYEIIPGIVTREDIKFLECSRFSIAGQLFCYEGTISDRSFVLYESHPMGTFETCYNRGVIIRDYFDKKLKAKLKDKL